MKRAYITIVFCFFAGLIISQESLNPMFVARSFFERGEYDKALEFIKSSNEAESDYRYMILEGEIFLQSGDYNSAISSFNRANYLLKYSGELGLARSYANMGDSRSSAFHLEQHLKSKFKEPWRKLNLDKQLQKIENSEDWRQLWKKSWYTQLEDGVAEVEYIIGRGVGVEDALEVAGGFTGLYNERPEVDYINGLILLAGGDLNGAINELRKSIEKDDTEIKVWVTYIDALGQSGDFIGASISAKEAISLFPDHLPFYLIRINWMRRAGDLAAAFREVTDILQYYPDKAEVLDLAGKLAYENKSYSKAILFISKNIDNYPGNPDYFFSRGDVYLATRTWEFAINDYSMALDLDPKNGVIYYNKAIALIETGKIENACHDLRQAMKLGNKKASSLINRYCIR